MSDSTIRDVARLANVSVASVSRALNGLNNVHADTRARVLAAAEHLDYTPNAAARSLSLARSHAIGVVLPDLHGEFFSELVRGMDRAASEHGYVLLLSNMHADADAARNVLRAMRGRVDGLVVMAPHIEPALLGQALPRSMPAVMINSRADGNAASIRLDNRAGIDAVVEHLAAEGRQRIVHVSGPPANIDAEERAQGFLAAMARHAPTIEPIVIPGDFTEESGVAAARTILAERGWDAVCAANDMMAIGCMHALRENGVRVPEDIAVAGFDDIPLARFLALTTVQVRIAEIGERAVTALLDRLKGGAGPPIEELHDPRLVARATTARSGRGPIGINHGMTS